MAKRQIPTAALTMLEQLGAADSAVAGQVLNFVLQSLDDTEYAVPLPPGALGYDVLNHPSEDIYTVSVTNCGGVSMERLRDKVWRHESVYNVLVSNIGTLREGRRGVTIDIHIVRLSAKPRAHCTWQQPPAKISSDDVTGLIVPKESRADALALIAALTTQASTMWKPEFRVAEEAKPRGDTGPVGYRLDAEPLNGVSMAFYDHLDLLLGADGVTGTHNLRNLVLTPCTFNNNTQHGLVASVYCRGHPPARPTHDPHRRALGVRAPAAPRSKSWLRSVAEFVLSREDNGDDQ